MECSECGGPLVPLGPMGNLFWFRCQNCGMDQNRPADEIEECGCCGDEAPDYDE